MSGVDLLLAVAGTGITGLVVAGMLLLTPRGVAEIPDEGADPDGSNLRSAGAPATTQR